VRVIRIDGPIGQAPGEFSAKWFRSQLPSDGSPVEVKFHSEGGSVFEAFAIYDAIAGYRGKKTATVESMAFSAASMLLCAFDDVAASPNAYVMLHAPYFDGDAPASEKKLLANLRERLINIYASKTRQPVATITRMIDQETFFDAEASVSLGIVNRISTASSAVMARLPARVLAKLVSSKTAGTTVAARWKAAVDAKARTMPRAKAIVAVDKSHPGLRLAMIREANRR
jgi:ATP-dependent Clp protease protease subunit